MFRNRNEKYPVKKLVAVVAGIIAAVLITSFLQKEMGLTAGNTNFLSYGLVLILGCQGVSRWKSSRREAVLLLVLAAMILPALIF